MLQHLSEEVDHFLGTDSFLVQFENEPTRSIDCGNRRNPSPLARYLLTRRQSTRSPGLSQKSSQRYVRLILKIQQSPVFLHGFADFRGLGRHPLLTSFLVHFKILPLRLLIGQAGIPQPSPDSVMRNRGLIFLLYNSVQATNRPQLGFIPKIRRRLQNDFPKSLLVEVFEQARPPTYLLSLKPKQAICIMSSNPPKERGSIDAKGFGNVAHRQATGDSFNGSDPNFKGRVPSLVTLFHNRELNNNQASCVNTMLQNFCDGP